MSASVTALLLAWREGDEAALARLTPLVHQELQRIARRCMRGERAGHSLQATALVNEAYLRLVDVRQVSWQNRAHFLAMTARVMRRILVEFARARGREKRGGGALKVTLAEGLLTTDKGPDSWPSTRPWRRWPGSTSGGAGSWSCDFSGA